MREYKFNVEKTVQECVEWIHKWFKTNAERKSAVIGISGGVDSAVAAALCDKALQSNLSLYMLPNMYQDDIQDAREVIAHFNYLSYPTVNIGRAYTEIIMELANSGIQASHQTRINLPPRLRTAVLYAIAQSIGGVVVNTSNLSESYVGYDTLFGDQCGSLSPLGKLTKTEILEMARYLKLPRRIWKKAPADGLTGKTDEEAFGFTYKELDAYIRELGVGVSMNTISEIKRKHQDSAFKRRMVCLDTFEPSEECLYE